MATFVNTKGQTIHVAKLMLFLDNYDSNGLPHNLNYDPDGSENNTDLKKTLSTAFLNDVSSKLPEGQRLQNRRPDWIKDSDIHITGDATIDITYVDEGAGYRNAIGYYIYDTDNPPRTFQQIKTLFVLFPNFSGAGKGGALQPGDTVRLAYGFTIDSNPNIAIPNNYVFPAGKSVGFVLFANAWRSYKNSLNRQGFKYYSDSTFNPESTPENRKHMVMVQSEVDADRIIVGFEDLNRDGNSDDDFNDAIFFISASPISNIDQGNVNKETEQTAKGTILMDDQIVQSSYVDNDFTDFVFEYNFTKSLSNGNITKLVMDFDFKHRSALYDHKFGLLINNISNYTKTINSELFIGDSSTAVTGEAYFSGDRLYIVNSTKTVLPGSNGSPYANTAPDWETAPTDCSSMRVVITFTEDVTDSDLGIKMPYLPFLEVYKSGDTTVGESYIIDYNNTYLSTNNTGLSKKIHKIAILEDVTDFNVSKEFIPMIDTYPEFKNFLESGRNKYNRWYEIKRDQYVHNLVSKVNRTYTIN